MTEQMPGDEVYSDDLADETDLEALAQAAAALAEQEYADEDVLEPGEPPLPVVLDAPVFLSAAAFFFSAFTSCTAFCSSRTIRDSSFSSSSTSAACFAVTSRPMQKRRPAATSAAVFQAIHR